MTAYRLVGQASGGILEPCCYLNLILQLLITKRKTKLIDHDIILMQINNRSCYRKISHVETVGIFL